MNFVLDMYCDMRYSSVTREGVMKQPISRNMKVLRTPQFVSHADLLAVAKRNHCAGIQVAPVLALCRPEKNFWVFKPTVYKSAKCRGFVGYGDAHPGNVSPLIFNHAEMRTAETRAVNRALRKA